MTECCQCADVAYVAGLFDGEGCVSVSPWVTADERERYHNDLFLGSQNLAALEFFRAVVGVGSISRRKDVWMYQVTGVKAVSVARLLLPHLRIKREVMALFVEFSLTFSARNTKPIPVDVALKRRDLSERIRHLMRADARAFAPVVSAATTED